MTAAATDYRTDTLTLVCVAATCAEVKKSGSCFLVSLGLQSQTFLVRGYNRYCTDSASRRGIIATTTTTNNIIIIIIGLFKSTAGRRLLPLTSIRSCPALFESILCFRTFVFRPSIELPAFPSFWSRLSVATQLPWWSTGCHFVSLHGLPKSISSYFEL